MTELAKLIHAQQENDEAVVITDRHITLDRTMHIYNDATFKNCDFEIAAHNEPRFVLEAEASATFENCRFVGILTKPSDGSSVHRAVISGAEGSAMTFIGCRMENADSFLYSEGAVNLHGCEIVYHGKAAAGDKAYKPVFKNPFMAQYMEIRQETSRAMQEAGFTAKNPAGALVCWFLSAEGNEVELTDCTVDCEVNGDYSVKISMEHGTLQSCTLKHVHEISADFLESCTLENCVIVNFQTEEGRNEALECRFIGCNEIYAMDAEFSACEFSDIRDEFVSENATLTGCTFCDMTPDTDGAIHIEKTRMDGCVFENITLKNDYYLFSADNDSELDDCTFHKCRTTRDDLQLVSAGGSVGKITRKWVEADICSDCTGLDKVIHLEKWEV